MEKLKFNPTEEKFFRWLLFEGAGTDKSLRQIANEIDIDYTTVKRIIDKNTKVNILNKKDNILYFNPEKFYKIIKIVFKQEIKLKKKIRKILVLQNATGVLQNATGVLQNATGVLQNATVVIDFTKGVAKCNGVISLIKQALMDFEAGKMVNFEKNALYILIFINIFLNNKYKYKNNKKNEKNFKIKKSGKILKLKSEENNLFIKNERISSRENKNKNSSKNEKLNIGSKLKEKIKSAQKVKKVSQVELQAIELVKFWNTLQGVRHHRKNSKAYKQAVKFFKYYLQNRFDKFIFNHDWLLERAIKLEDVKFDFETIKKTLRETAEMLQKSNNPTMNLSDLLFNPVTGKSTFLYVYFFGVPEYGYALVLEKEEFRFALGTLKQHSGKFPDEEHQKVLFAFNRILNFYQKKLSKLDQFPRTIPPERFLQKFVEWVYDRYGNIHPRDYEKLAGFLNSYKIFKSFLKYVAYVEGYRDLQKFLDNGENVK